MSSIALTYQGEWLKPHYKSRQTHPLRDILHDLNISRLSSSDVRSIKWKMSPTYLHYLLAKLSPATHVRLFLHLLAWVFFSLALAMAFRNNESSFYSNGFFSAACLFFTASGWFLLEDWRERLISWERMLFNPRDESCKPKTAHLRHIYLSAPQELRDIAAAVKNAEPRCTFEIEYALDDPFGVVILDKERYYILHWE